MRTTIKTWKIKIALFFTIVTICIFASCSDKSEHTISIEEYADYIQYEEQRDILKRAIAECNPRSENYGKSVGVFGGSLSSLPESEMAKGLWERYLNMDVKTYGMLGHGFSVNQGSIQRQVELAGRHDIYILWASTNDYTNVHDVGMVTDYTEADGFEESKRATQCGGINYCIKKLREKNPECTIYLFTSLKFFDNTGRSSSGYLKESTDTNGTGLNFYDYTQKQKECAAAQGISYFDQWEAQEGHITPENYRIYYKEDAAHMTENGYFDIGIRQLFFLAQN